MKKRTQSNIGKANRAKGHRTNSFVRDLLCNLLGLRVYIIHRADGDPDGADLLVAEQDVLVAGIQVKSMKELPKSITNSLSDDGFAVFKEDSGRTIFIAEISCLSRLTKWLTRCESLASRQAAHLKSGDQGVWPLGVLKK